MKIFYKISDLIAKLGNVLKFIGVLSDSLDYFNKRFEEEFPKDKRPADEVEEVAPEEVAEQTAQQVSKRGK